MNPFWLICLAIAAIVSNPGHLRADEPVDTRLFELRTYYTNPGKLEALHSRFRDHTVRLFEKHGMTNVAYWVPTSNEEQILVYLLAYPDLEAREASWKAFQADPEWKAAYAESTREGKLIRRVDSVFLEPTDYSPVAEIARQDPPRLFELRRYTTNPGKLPALDARFRDHTMGLFARHGMTNLPYFHLSPGQDKAEVTLIYLLAHPDNRARDDAFEAFRQDPDWQGARDASEKAGPILIQGGVESLLLSPVDYSPMK